VLNRFPFAIIYREKAVSVQVLAIAHGHRRARNTGKDGSDSFRPSIDPISV
jgi:hypothetical protein